MDSRKIFISFLYKGYLLEDLIQTSINQSIFILANIKFFNMIFYYLKLLHFFRKFVKKIFLTELYKLFNIYIKIIAMKLGGKYDRSYLWRYCRFTF